MGHQKESKTVVGLTKILMASKWERESESIKERKYVDLYIRNTWLYLVTLQVEKGVGALYG